MGSRTERLLLEDIEELDKGYIGIKTDLGGHGGFKTDSDAGDLIVGKSVTAQDIRTGPPSGNFYTNPSTFSQLFIIEEKYKSTDANKYLQEDGEKFDAMIEFAEQIGATPTIAVRWSSNLEWSPGPFHLLQDAREIERTRAGNVSIKPETAESDFQRVEDFF